MSYDILRFGSLMKNERVGYVLLEESPLPPLV